MGYTFRLAASVLLYAPSHRQDSTYHGLCYTSRGALAGTRNSSMGPPRHDDCTALYSDYERLSIRRQIYSKICTKYTQIYLYRLYLTYRGSKSCLLSIDCPFNSLKKKQQQRTSTIHKKQKTTITTKKTHPKNNKKPQNKQTKNTNKQTNQNKTLNIWYHWTMALIQLSAKLTELFKIEVCHYVHK